MTERVPEALRQIARKRALNRCEYCRKPETASVYSHHADHIIPSVHQGKTEVENIAWSCFQCNVMKGSNIASYDEITHELTPLFNQRHQEWHDHFELDNALIFGRTPIGRVTVRVLQLNHPEQIITRQRLIRAGRF